jgi:hypothetical protein
MTKSTQNKVKRLTNKPVKSKTPPPPAAPKDTPAAASPKAKPARKSKPTVGFCDFVRDQHATGKTAEEIVKLANLEFSRNFITPGWLRYTKEIMERVDKAKAQAAAESKAKVERITSKAPPLAKRKAKIQQAAQDKKG